MKFILILLSFLALSLKLSATSTSPLSYGDSSSFLKKSKSYPFKNTELYFDFSYFNLLKSRIIKDKNSHLFQFYQRKIISDSKLFRNTNQFSFGFVENKNIRSIRYNFRLKSMIYLGDKFYFESFNYIQPRFNNLNDMLFVSNNSIVNNFSNYFSLKVTNQIYSGSNSRTTYNIVFTVRIILH